MLGPPPAYSTKIDADMFPSLVPVLVYFGARADAAFAQAGPPPAYSDANSGAGAGGNAASSNAVGAGVGANAAQVNAAGAGAGAASPANAGASAVPGGPSVMVEDDEQPGSQPASSLRRGS